ncbi:MAG: hypothetical protein ABR584_02120 [Candidatus Baltobacteraceae bacterium]
MKFATMYRSLAALVACTVVSAQPVLAQSIAPGHWVGRGNSYGQIYKQGKGHGVTSADSYGRFTINLYVSKAGHVAGTLNFGGGANSYVHGGHGHFTYWSGEDLYASTDPHGSVAFNGVMNLRGVVAVSGMEIPMEAVAPASVVMHFTHLDCGSGTGDLAMDARKSQQKVGFTTNVKAPFVLLRLGDAQAPGMNEGQSDLNDWLQVVGSFDADLEIDYQGKSKQYIADQIKKGFNVLEEMDKYKECGGKAPLPPAQFAEMKALLTDDIGLAQLRLKNML